MQHYLQRTVKTEEEPTSPVGTTGKQTWKDASA
jgi:hypothetical protein